eukprot:7390997-Prymnesium_polylepis.1
MLRIGDGSLRRNCETVFNWKKKRSVEGGWGASAQTIKIIPSVAAPRAPLGLAGRAPGAGCRWDGARECSTERDDVQEQPGPVEPHQAQRGGEEPRGGLTAAYAGASARLPQSECSAAVSPVDRQSAISER